MYNQNKNLLLQWSILITISCEPFEETKKKRKTDRPSHWTAAVNYSHALFYFDAEGKVERGSLTARNNNNKGVTVWKRTWSKKNFFRFNLLSRRQYCRLKSWGKSCACQVQTHMRAHTHTHTWLDSEVCPQDSWVTEVHLFNANKDRRGYRRTLVHACACV